MFAKIRSPIKYLIYFITALIILAIISVIIYFLISNASADKNPKGIVVSNGYKCAEIGASILEKGGNAVDAAIAALFCEGVSMPQSMGLGGGFLMTIYNKEKRKAVALNARETAPAGASQDMFDGDSELSTRGGLAVAVPGELKGYWEAYNKYGGKVPWKDLVQPTIDMCKEGILVTDYLASLYRSIEDRFRKDDVLKETFIDPKTNHSYAKGEKIKRLRLAKTLELVAEEGADVLYNGVLTKSLVKDINDHNGNFTEDDLKNYTVEWQDPITVSLPFSQTLYTAPLPGSGVILNFIMNILNGFIDYSHPASITNWQRIIESFKFGYGKRTELGDMKFVDVADLITNLTSTSYAKEIRKKISDNDTSQDPNYYGAKTVQPEDHGTAHLCVFAPNGDAVSVTSTINLYFGAGFMSNSTGIILNDEMDDFSSPNINNSFGLPPSVANFIAPGKRPLSSMVPSIIVNDQGDVELIIGAAGGTKITTAVAQIMVKHLWFNVPIVEAVASRRLHHQLFPMEVQMEKSFENDTEFIDAIHKIGHEYSISDTSGFSAVTAISYKNGTLQGAADPRRSGQITSIY